MPTEPVVERSWAEADLALGGPRFFWVVGSGTVLLAIAFIAMAGSPRAAARRLAAVDGFVALLPLALLVCLAVLHSFEIPVLVANALTVPALAILAVRIVRPTPPGRALRIYLTLAVTASPACWLLFGVLSSR